MGFEAADIITGEVGEVKFFTSYHRPLKQEGELLTQESKTERAYIPPAELIKDMMGAGEQLLAARKARYDTDLVAEGEEVGLDPTREPGLDLADLSRQAKGLNERLSASQAASEKAAADAKAAADKAAFEQAVAAAAAELVKNQAEGHA